MKEVQTITRKVQIYPVGDKKEIDRVYKYIRDIKNREINKIKFEKISDVTVNNSFV